MSQQNQIKMHSLCIIQSIVTGKFSKLGFFVRGIIRAIKGE